MVIKYNRTSTINQKGGRFELDKNKYDLTINDFGVSGKIPFKKREGGFQLIELVNEGKVEKVVFEDLSRCGRTLKDSINTLDFFLEKGVVIKIRNIGIESHTPNGDKNPMWNIVTSILSSVYEMERERNLAVTEMGRKNYVMKGGKLGRKVGSTYCTDVRQNHDRRQWAACIGPGLPWSVGHNPAAGRKCLRRLGCCGSGRS